MLVVMDQPFAAPDPSTQVPSSPPGATSPPPGPRRGRMAVATVAAAGLIGVGVVGVTQLASADDDPGEPSAFAATGVAVTDDQPTGDATTEDDASGGDQGDGDRMIDGEIVIDVGDGDPVTIDLGEIDAADLESLRECVGLPAFDDLELSGLPFDLESGQLDEFLGGLDGDLQEWLDGLDGLELPDFATEFDGDLFMGPDGNHITVLGPDGVQIIDLGDGDATVTITQNDGELEITTDGDATVTEPADLFGDLLGAFPELDGDLDLSQLLDDLPFDLEELPFDLENLPNLDEFDLPAIELPDADELRRCLDQLG